MQAGSKANAGEAAAVVALVRFFFLCFPPLHAHTTRHVFQVQMLLEEGVPSKDIGVIAPYNAQALTFFSNCRFLF